MSTVSYRRWAMLFEWGIAIHDAEIERAWGGEKSWGEALTQLRGVFRKARRQVVKDYVAFPLLAGPAFVPMLLGNFAAQRVGAHGHLLRPFPDGAEVFTEEQLDGETPGEWYVRQLLGSANIDGGPLFHVMSGHLSHQIDHHLLPDLPSNRHDEIAPRVRAHTTGPLMRQTASVWKRVLRLALPGPKSGPEEARGRTERQAGVRRGLIARHDRVSRRARPAAR